MDVFSLPAVAGLLAVFAGCGGPAATGPQPAPPRPFDGVTLKVACPGAAAQDVVGRYGRAWAARQNVRLEMAAYDSQRGPEAVEGADVWLIEPAALGRWAAADRLAPLPDDYTHERPAAGSGDQPKYDWVGLLPLYRERLLRWGERALALPVLGEAPLCFYRLDLFHDPANKDAFRARYHRDLEPPATWEDFADIAEFFNDRPATRPSLPPLGDDDEADVAFYSVAASSAVRPATGLGLPTDRDARGEVFSFHFDFVSGEPRVASPGFVHALELLRRLQRCRAAADGRPGPERFAEGKAVLCLADASWIGRFEANPAKPAFGVCRVPGSRVLFDPTTGAKEEPPGGTFVPYLGASGYLGVVPRGAAVPEAAFALLADLSGPETARQVVIEPAWGGGAFRRDQFSSSLGWSSFGMDQAQTMVLLQALQQTLIHAGLGNPATRLRLPDEAAYRKALLEEVRAALAGTKDAATALKAAEGRWRALGPAERRRTDYALSLGLTPR